MNVIQTSYKGYLFRSRLEARWAVFFDKLPIAWEYEREGFELDNGNRYLPDFYLPEIDCWVEVKPGLFNRAYEILERYKEESQAKWEAFGQHKKLVIACGIPHAKPMPFFSPENFPEWGEVLLCPYLTKPSYGYFWACGGCEDWCNVEPYKSAIIAAKTCNFISLGKSPSAGSYPSPPSA